MTRMWATDPGAAHLGLSAVHTRAPSRCAHLRPRLRSYALAAGLLIRAAASATPGDLASSDLGRELIAIRETGGVFRRRPRTTPNP
jgi:hypothetical protein